MAGCCSASRAARVLVVGTVASVLPEVFADLDVTVVKGEAEQLLWKLDEVLARPGAIVQLGTMEDLDRLPLPDWSPFGPERFRIGYDFWRFPTALDPGQPRLRDEVQLLPLHRAGQFHPVAQSGGGGRGDAPRDSPLGFPLVQVPRSALRAASRSGVRVGRADRPPAAEDSVLDRDAHRLAPGGDAAAAARRGADEHHRGHRNARRRPVAPLSPRLIREDRQREFILLAAAWASAPWPASSSAFPTTPRSRSSGCAQYAQELNPTYANFNVVTPYPGTAFFEQMRPQIADTDFSHYTVYTPLLKYEHLTRQRMEELVAKCFTASISAGSTCGGTRRCCGRCCGSWVLESGRLAKIPRRAEAGRAAVASRR